MLNRASQIKTLTLYLSRRLMQGLSALRDTPISFIHAPMGYGKTVAIREYLLRQKARAIWTSVLTSDPNTFWRDFCRVLRKNLPGEATTLEALEELNYPSDPVKLDAAREMFSRLIFPVGAVLIFDDVHILGKTGPGGLVQLCLLLVRQGSIPPIVFISRYSPDDALAEPILKRIVKEIGPALFTFNEKEIQAYYKCCGISLDLNASRRLFKATGGWISALYLYLLHYNQYGTMAAPTKPHALLASQIFDKFQEDTQRLLLFLSPLECFSVPQGQLFSENAEAVFVDLVRHNAFVTYDPVTRCYTCHALFREFLQKQFSQLPQNEQQAAYLRNAEWLVGHDKLRKAAKLLIQLDDFTKAFDLLSTAAEQMQITEGNGVLLALFRACPPDLLIQYPRVMFRYAMAALSAGDFQTFSKIIAQLVSYCGNLPKDESTANNYRGELELLRSLTKYNDIEAMSVHHKRAEEFFQRSGAGGSRLFGHDPWTLGSPSVLYMFHRQRGGLEKELKQLRNCLPHYSRLTGMHGAGAEDILLAEMRYNSGEFNSATIAAHRARSTAQEYDQVCVEVCALFLFAKLHVQQGEYDQAIDDLRAMRELVERKKAFSLLQTVDLCMGLLHVSIRKTQKIPEWLLQGKEEKLYAFARGSSNLVLGSVLLLTGQYAKLIGRFSLLLQRRNFAPNLMFTIYAQLFIAAGNTGLGRQAKSDVALLTALDLALPDKLYMPFVVHSVFLPQLKNLKNDKTYGDGVRRILKMSSSFEKVRNGIIFRFFPENTRPLTPRECELVRLALTGMTYKNIAAAAGLAPNSVKRYFATLYKKLGINNREQLKKLFSGGGNGCS